MWFVERLLDPKTIDPKVDARLRGIVAHQTLRRSTPASRSGSERTRSTRPGLTRPSSSSTNACARRSRGRFASSFRRWTCSSSKARSAVISSCFFALRSTWAYRSSRAASRCRSERLQRAELQRGLELEGFTVSGKIDRVDVDLFSASAVVQDYKSGEAFSASKIASERRLQMPLYVLALRDLLGLEPLGGLYRSLSGEREARGMVRAGARGSVPGLLIARLHGRGGVLEPGRRPSVPPGAAVGRIRSGDVRHDPRFGTAPRGMKAGLFVGSRLHEPVQPTPSSSLPSTSPAWSSSRPARAPGRRRCSSSATRRPWSSGGFPSTRCSSSPTRNGRPVSFASGSAPGYASSAGRSRARHRAGLDFDDSRLLLASAPCPPVRSGARSAVSRARRGTGLRTAE